MMMMIMMMKREGYLRSVRVIALLESPRQIGADWVDEVSASALDRMPLRRLGDESHPHECRCHCRPPTDRPDRPSDSHMHM